MDFTPFISSFFPFSFVLFYSQILADAPDELRASWERQIQPTGTGCCGKGYKWHIQVPLDPRTGEPRRQVSWNILGGGDRQSWTLTLLQKQEQRRVFLTQKECSHWEVRSVRERNSASAGLGWKFTFHPSVHPSIFLRGKWCLCISAYLEKEAHWTRHTYTICACHTQQGLRACWGGQCHLWWYRALGAAWLWG